MPPPNSAIQPLPRPRTTMLVAVVVMRTDPGELIVTWCPLRRFVIDSLREPVIVT